MWLTICWRSSEGKLDEMIVHVANSKSGFCLNGCSRWTPKRKHFIDTLIAYIKDLQTISSYLNSSQPNLQIPHDWCAARFPALPLFFANSSCIHFGHHHSFYQNECITNSLLIPMHRYNTTSSTVFFYQLLGLTWCSYDWWTSFHRLSLIWRQMLAKVTLHERLITSYSTLNCQLSAMAEYHINSIHSRSSWNARLHNIPTYHPLIWQTIGFHLSRRIPSVVTLPPKVVLATCVPLTPVITSHGCMRFERLGCSFVTICLRTVS